MYKELVYPLIEKFDSEKAHNFVKKGFHLAQEVPGGTKALQLATKSLRRFSDPRLAVNLAGVGLDNPVILGAGWDKNGECVSAVYYGVGFGAVEVGTIPLFSQPGNTGYRQHVFDNGASWNWLGIPSEGAAVVAYNLRKHRGVPMGGNIGINSFTKPGDVPRDLYDVTSIIAPNVAYLTLNHSCKNVTHSENLMDKKYLEDSVQAINQALTDSGLIKPLFIKYSPDMQRQGMIDGFNVARDNGVAGFIVANSTANPEIKRKYGERWVKYGSLAGNDHEYRSMTTRQVAFVYNETGGEFVIMGVGGVKDAHSALEKILAGASAVQLVSAMRTEGLSVVKNINTGLAEYLDILEDDSIRNLVGLYSKQYPVFD